MTAPSLPDRLRALADEPDAEAFFSDLARESADAIEAAHLAGLNEGLETDKIARQSLRERLNAAQARIETLSEHICKVETQRGLAWLERDFLTRERDQIRASLEAAQAENRELARMMVDESDDPAELLDRLELRHLREEVNIARERLGPAGWKLLEELQKLRQENASLRDLFRDFRDNYDCDTGANGAHPEHCRACRASQALASAAPSPVSRGAKCPDCGGEVKLVKDDPPYNVDHLQCVDCDSTFILDEAAPSPAARERATERSEDT